VIVLVDTDVLIDVALDRVPHAAAAGQLLDRFEQQPGSAYVAWHTIAHFYYLTAPTRGRSNARSFIMDLIQFVEVSPTTTDSLRRAARLEMKDFEDAMQVAAAESCGADVIATRNVRDYAKSPVSAAAPKALLAELV